MGVFQSVFGRKPKVPALPKIDFNLEQQRTVTGNQQALPYAEELGRGVNTFNQEELDRLYNLALPGYDRIKNQVGENLTALTKGEIPQDVQDQLFRSKAVQAFRGGFAGSGLQRNLTARDFGLTSLALTGQGQDSAQRWLQSATAPRFDITSMFLTPSQRIPMVTNERDTQWNAQWLRNQVKAMPDPVARGIHDGLVNLLMGAANGYGAGYATSSPSDWGRTTNPNSGVGNSGGMYQPNQGYNPSNPAQPDDYSRAAYGPPDTGGGGFEGFGDIPDMGSVGSGAFY